MSLTAEQRARLRRATAEYVAAAERGETVPLSDLTERHPDLAQELAEFLVFYQTTERAPLRPEAPADAESSAARRALAARFGAGQAPPASLVEAGQRAGLTPAALAARLGVGLDVLSKLERRLVRAATVPAAFLARLGDALGVAPAALAAYLDQPPRPAVSGALLHADAPPDLPAAQSFAEALRASPLTEDAARARWLALAPEQPGEGG